jgi:hypothetical protein
MALKKKIKTKYKIIEKYPETPNSKTGEVVDGIAIYPEEIEKVAKQMEVPVHYVKDGVLLHEYIHKEYPKLSPKEFSKKFKELYLKLYPDIKKEYLKKILDFSGHFSKADMEIYKKYGEIKVVNPQNPNMNNSIPPELEPLVKEMRKYKVVEEFLGNLKKVIEKRLPELRKSYEELTKALTTKGIHTSTKLKTLSNFRRIGKELTKEIAQALGYKDIMDLPFKIDYQLRSLTSEYSFDINYTPEKWIDLLNKRISEMTGGLKFADLFNLAIKGQNPNNPNNPNMEEEQHLKFELGTFKTEGEEIRQRIFIEWHIYHHKRNKTTVDGNEVNEYYSLRISGEIKKGKRIEDIGQIEDTIWELKNRNELELSILEEDFYRLMQCWRTFNLNDFISDWDKWLLLRLPKWVFEVGKRLKKYIT